jgi:hypothetical protein
MSARSYEVWTDPDLAPVVREEPELAAIADAFREAMITVQQRAPRRRLRRVYVLAATIAVGLSAGLIASWSGADRAGIVDRALAAIGTRPVLHVVIQAPAHANVIDLKTASASALPQETEIWFDESRSLKHTVVRVGSNVLLNEVETANGWFTPAGRRDSSDQKPTVDRALQSFVDGYRKALASGAAKEAGAETFQGTKVVWISFPLENGQSEKIALDARTSRPLFMRMSSDTGGLYAIKRIETIPFSSTDFEPPAENDAARHAFSGGVIDLHDVAVSPSSLVTDFPFAVWIGATFDGIPLAAAYRETTVTSFGDGSSKKADGIRLFYGTLTPTNATNFDQPYIQLSESSDPPSPYFGPVGATPADPTQDNKLYLASSPLGFFGSLHLTGGAYVTIRASDEAMLRAAAKALSPITPMSS